jgi:hypothetical protein
LSRVRSNIENEVDGLLPEQSSQGPLTRIGTWQPMDFVVASPSYLFDDILKH